MKATVDRIEGSMAVLITHGDNPISFNIPTPFLDDAREGEVVDITIRKDPKSTQAARERVSSLIQKLQQKSNL